MYSVPCEVDMPCFLCFLVSFLFLFSNFSCKHCSVIYNSKPILYHYCGRHSGLVVSVLDSSLRGPGSSPLSARVIVLCSWAKHFTLTLPFSTQEYKWLPANCQGNLRKCWEVTCDGLASHPGGVAILLVTSCYRK